MSRTGVVNGISNDYPSSISNELTFGLLNKTRSLNMAVAQESKTVTVKVTGGGLNTFWTPGFAFTVSTAVIVIV